MYKAPWLMQGRVLCGSTASRYHGSSIMIPPSITGWPPVVRDLGLKASGRAQLEPVRRDPWRLHLILLLADAAASV